MFKGLTKRKSQHLPRTPSPSIPVAPSPTLPPPPPSTGLMARFTNSTASCVREYGIAHEQNPAFRQTMEDAHIVLDGFFGHSDWTYIGLHDGHGGVETADLAARKLHKYLAAALKSGYSVDEALRHAYLRTDEECVDLGHDIVGCTAVSILLRPDLASFNHPSLNDSDSDEDGTPPVQLTVANVGDSSVFLIRGNQAIHLTQIHRPNDPSETRRINEVGGFILSGRVNGTLAVTRALGDAMLKPAVIAEPFIKSTILTEHDECLFVVCDGVTDVLSGADLEEIFRKNKNKGAQSIANTVVRTSLERGSTDNISVIVVFF
ncbi:hypothetical protein RCL1_005688 [Eukaryota sp. TZLM3-RCL]